MQLSNRWATWTLAIRFLTLMYLKLAIPLQDVFQFKPANSFSFLASRPNSSSKHPYEMPTALQGDFPHHQPPKPDSGMCVQRRLAYGACPHIHVQTIHCTNRPFYSPRSHQSSGRASPTILSVSSASAATYSKCSSSRLESDAWRDAPLNDSRHNLLARSSDGGMYLVQDGLGNEIATIVVWKPVVQKGKCWECMVRKLRAGC